SWQSSAIEAQNMGIPATAIEAAVAARSLSSMKSQREAAEKIFGTQAVSFPIEYGPELNKDLELALFAAKIGAYAQG
ncbi:NADP-dependent phosphogluconate dehydrogenase, partial [Rhizobium ruizarguesonis]